MGDNEWTLSQKLVFFILQLYLNFWVKSQHAQIFWCNLSFLQFNHIKDDNPSISEHLNFWSIPSLIEGVIACELGPLEITAHFLGEKKTTPSESWVGCGNFKPKGGGPTYTKSDAKILSTQGQ